MAGAMKGSFSQNAVASSGPSSRAALMISHMRRSDLGPARGLVTRQAGPGERQRADPRRMGHGEIDRDPAAEREPYEVDLVDLEVVEQRSEILGVRVEHVGPERAAVAPDVIADDAEVPGKSGELIVPHAAVQLTAVDEHDGRSSPLDFIEEARPVDGGETMPDVLGWFGVDGPGREGNHHRAECSCDPMRSGHGWSNTNGMKDTPGDRRQGLPMSPPC